MLTISGLSTRMANLLSYKASDPAEALKAFERLVVDTQACDNAAMRWLVAMDEGFFPYLRDACPARLILVHRGPAQNGKTSGAQRFTLLHGLGPVKASYSVAALRNMGDCGLVVLDNKEHANLHQDLIDYLLTTATGGEDGRSFADGSIRKHGRNRPALVITSIEGMFKAELRARCVEIPYEVQGAKRTGRAAIEHEITKRCHEIGSALMAVLHHYLRGAPKECPNPMPEFEEHFIVLCGLLRAYGEITGKPQDWSEEIIERWDLQLRQREAEESELEYPIWSIIQSLAEEVGTAEWNGKSGRLYVTEAGALLERLQAVHCESLPKTPAGLTRRLKSSAFVRFTFLGTDTPGLPSLQRKSNRRPIGFFAPNDELGSGEVKAA
jgi:hypothetical protein